MFKKTQVCNGVLVALGGALLATSVPVTAQTAQRIEITGSSIKRLDVEGALPVQTISREQIERSGVVNTEALLQALPAISSQGGVATTTGAGSSTYGRATISVRGLGDARTLVLVNGRRVAAFAGGGGAAVNVNTIPLAAIARVEVLLDGASSVYGSDAIAGVINFILSKDYQGLELSATASTPTRSGGGGSQKASIVGGIGNLGSDGYNITLSASVERERELKAFDREFSKSGNQFPFLVAGATGQGNIEGAINPVTGTRAPGFGGSPGTGYGNPLAATDKCSDIGMFKNPTPTSKGLPYCAFDSSGVVALLPDRDASSLTLNGAFRINDSIEAFGDLLYGRSVVTQRIQPSPVRRSFLLTDDLFTQQNVVPALLLRPTNPNYGIAANYLNANGHPELVGQTLAITARVFDFGLRTSEDTATQSRGVVGLRGQFAGQEYEIAYSHNESKTEGSVINGYFSQVAYAKIIANPASDWNPFSLTQSAAFNAQLPSAEYRGPTLSAKSKSDVIDGKLAGDVFKLPSGMAQYAVGLQSRNESYTTQPSAALGTGDIAGLGGSVPPVDRDRRIDAVYGELNIPLLKSLEGNVAARYDKYDDVGNASTYKAALRWQPTKEVLLRGSVGSGFRAPTLTDLWEPQTLGTSEQFNDPLSGQRNLQVNALTGGNPDLKPEKSRQASVGIVLQPVQDLSIGVDLWTIKIREAINTPSAQEVVSGFRAGNPTYANAVRLAPSGDIDSITQVLVNSGDVKAAGVDLDARYRLSLSSSRLDFRLNGTYVDKYEEISPGGTTSYKVGTIVDGNGDPVIGAADGGVILRWRHVLTATWTTGPWSVSLAQNYSSGYETGFRQIDGERNFLSSQSLYDAYVGYEGFKNVKLAFGVKNLFDKNPPGIFVPVSNQFQAGYDVTQYDARARTVLVTASYKFR